MSVPLFKALQRTLLLVVGLVFAGNTALALTAAPPAGVTLEGHWTVNVAASDDAEALLEKRMKELAEEQRRFEEKRRRAMRDDPFAWELEVTPLDPTPQRRAAMEERQRAVRQMLGMTSFLSIAQEANGAKLQLTSQFETRRLNAGSRSQVSLPQGQLANLESGWERDTFVIERTARDGPRITERYRKLKNTDQLEALITIKGDSALSGMKIRRVYDRAAAAPATPDPGAGPVK